MTGLAEIRALYREYLAGAERAERERLPVQQQVYAALKRGAKQRGISRES